MQNIDFSQHKKILVQKSCPTTYGNNFKMNILIFCLSLLALCNGFVLGEYPGRRHQITQVSPDEKHYLIEQLSNFIDQQARRRFQQQIHLHNQKQRVSQEITGPGFSFLLPPISQGDFQTENDGPVQFAVPPFDSRYYQENAPTNYDEAEEDLSNSDDFEPNIINDNANRISISDYKNKILIPPPMHVNHEESGNEKMHQNIENQLNKQPDVLQKPLQVEFDNTMSLYIVALIAGISCAFSTGLIAIGLMYWTLYKKSKSADSCDYPCDYGIIGPRSKNQDNSQTALGDKKLAHSAQMFHYQHQKQQIIAMENRNGTDAHNDDENDSDDNENDFTVYECPGLAEVQGMEVNNPIFNQCETPASKNEKSQSNTSSKAVNQK